MLEAPGTSIAERLLPVGTPIWSQTGWAERFPWLAQGTTGRGDADEPWDLGLAGDQPVGRVLDRWRELRSALGMPAAVHSRQAHRADLQEHVATAPGLHVGEGIDGHLTAEPGVLLTVSVADCVPVFVVDPDRRAVALLHAGWRGVAAGVLEAGLDRLCRGGSAMTGLWVHFGPAICGDCYEVGTDVHRAVFSDRAPPRRPEPIDLRAALAVRAERRGVPASRITRSEYCTRCGPARFFSHRAGSGGRQMGVIGIRPRSGP